MTEATNPRLSIRRVWLWAIAIVWATVAVGLWSLWPVEPRLTFRGDVEIVGITPDSRYLVALTNRAIHLVNDQSELSGVPSGPIQIWDLATGRHHLVCIPEQSCSGDPAECADGITRPLDPDGWHIRRSPPLRGRSLLMTPQHIVGLNLHWQDMVFDTQSEKITVLKQGRHPKDASRTGVGKLSPGGRWFADEYWLVPNPPITYAILEAASGRQQLAIEFNLDPNERHNDVVVDYCFSPDDRYFACAVFRDGSKTTRIWNMDTKELICTIDRPLWEPVFSQDGRWLAGYDLQAAHSGIGEVFVYDVSTGAVVKRWKPVEPKPNTGAHHLALVDHDKCLLCYDREMVNAGSVCQTTVIPRFAWNLETGDIKSDYANQSYVVTSAGSAFTGLPWELSPPQFGIDDNGLCEIPTGRRLYSTPADSLPMLLTSDGRTLVIEQYEMNTLWQLSERFRIPVPSFLMPFITDETILWRVIDVASGRTIASLPSQHYQFWLSPDQKTLVTISNDVDSVGPDRTINVWDFPPRRLVLKPLAWSLVVPAVLLLPMGLRRLRWRILPEVARS